MTATTTQVDTWSGRQIDPFAHCSPSLEPHLHLQYFLRSPFIISPTFVSKFDYTAAAVRPYNFYHNSGPPRDDSSRFTFEARKGSVERILNRMMKFPHSIFF